MVAAYPVTEEVEDDPIEFISESPCTDANSIEVMSSSWALGSYSVSGACSQPAHCARVRSRARPLVDFDQSAVEGVLDEVRWIV